MNDAILPIEGPPLDREAFEHYLRKNSESKNTTSMALTVVFGRILAHWTGKFEPSGTIDFLYKEIERRESERKYDRIVDAVFALYEGFRSIREDLSSAQKDMISGFLDQYVRHAVEDPVREKIKLFRNILLGGCRSQPTNVEMVGFYLDLTRELSYTQLTILTSLSQHDESALSSDRKFFQLSDIRDPADMPKGTSIAEIAANLNIEVNFAILLVTGLIGRGLLFRLSRMDGGLWSGTTEVNLTDSARQFLDFLKHSPDS